MIRFRIHGVTLGWALATLLGVACGGNANTPGTPDTDGAVSVDRAATNGDSAASGDVAAQGHCAQGQTYCPACGGRGFCATGACPGFVCPASDGGDSDASSEAGTCAASQQTCHECSGGVFCASVTCPDVLCPTQDASLAADGAANDARADGPSGDVAADVGSDVFSMFDSSAFGCNSGGATCAPGLTCCRGCVNEQNDPLNCGGCGIQCTGATPMCETHTCIAQTCMPPCGTGQVCCDVPIGGPARLLQCYVGTTCPVGCPSCQ